MGVGLRPLRADEYDGWLSAWRAWYRFDLAEHGGLSADQAAAKSEYDLASLFPAGVPPSGHLLFAIEDDGRRVGSLWIAERPGEGRPVGYLYGLLVEESERGRGYGRRAMELLEEIARDRGLGSIELNVFAGNAPARALYRRLGYREQAVYMGKALT